MKRIPFRPAVWFGALLLAIALGVFLIYTNRWHIGRKAVEIVDPSVRAWATKEVARLSGGAYQLTASTLLVDEARRRISIDTITVITDTIANKNNPSRLPRIALRFRNCALEGIDLTQLTAGKGLHVTRGGCDSVAVTVDVPPGMASSNQVKSIDTHSFLNFTQKLNLPRDLPFIALDTLNFPEVRLTLSITGSNGRPTNVSFDRLSAQFDSMLYKRGSNSEPNRVLLSRDVRLSLERFEGSHQAASNVSLKLLSANLARGTLRLDSLRYAPLPGGFADSLGVKELQVGHLSLYGVDWRRFLISGDIEVGKLLLTDALIRLPFRAPPTRAQRAAKQVAEPPASLETTLRALDRSIRLDTMVANHLTVISEGPTKRDSSAITVKLLQTRNLGFDNVDSTWRGPHPLGKIELTADSILKTGSGERVSLGSLIVYAKDSKILAGRLSAGAQGTDADFLRRTPYRKDRLSLTMAVIRMDGVNIPEFVTSGKLHVQQTAVEHLSVDVLSDRNMRVKPGKPDTHRFPQEVLRDLGMSVQADTVTVAGGDFTYRERDSASTAPGILKFTNLNARVLGLQVDQDTAVHNAMPLSMNMDARLMGVGLTHMTLTFPLDAKNFQMHFKGTIGGMRVDSLNSFLGNTSTMLFTAGEIQSITFDAAVDNGHATGTLTPRWKSLSIALPGVAKGSTGLVGGLRRAVAKMAANAFVIRSDNFEPGKAKDGVIDHRWKPEETLPAFIWLSLREALMPLLKK